MIRSIHTSHTPAIQQSRPTSKIRYGLFLLIVAFVTVATAFNATIPPYENLDELEHAEAVRYIATTGRLPVHDVAEAEGYQVRQEASQPPLYHILAAGWMRLLGLPTAPHTPTSIPGNVVACGITGTRYNKATWIHNPYRQLPAPQRATTTVHGLRVFSTLLQTFTLLGVWILAKRVFSTGPVAFLATSLVAFNPQLLLLAADVSNDNAIIPIATWGLVVAFDVWHRPLSWKRSMLFGLLSGLAALSKLSGAALLGIGGLALLAQLAQRRSSFRTIVVHGILMCMTATALVTPWILRNLTLYGDPTALAPMLAKVGTREGTIALGEARLMILSYWGQLPCAFYPRALYWPYLILMAGGLTGIAVRWRTLTTTQRALIGMCAIWFATITVAWIRWDMLTAATGGRLLFPAISALALILAAGWSRWSPRLSRFWTAALPIWAIVVLVCGPLLMMSPPKQKTPSVSEIAENGSFGDMISISDAEARVVHTPLRCLLQSRAYCGQVLELAFSAEALAPIDEDLTLVIQLVSPRPGATDLRLNYNHWPGRGNLPASVWPVGLQIRERYSLPLPEANVDTQAWRVTIAYVDPADGRRLPVTVDNQDAGDSLSLDLVRVGDQQPEAGQIAQLEHPITFRTDDAAGALILKGADVVISNDGLWTAHLLWECKEAVDVDAVTFVHAYDDTGQLLVAGDAPPKQGAFPTSLWRQGDRIRSDHPLAVGPSSTPDRIAVGMYLPESGQRLAATQDGIALPDNAVVIWRKEP